MIWVPSEAEAWEPANLISSSATAVKARLISGKEVNLAGPIEKYDTLSSVTTLNQDYDNLIDLESVNEGIILHHIKKRFQKESIYTQVGTILVALNPYKSLNLYGSELVDSIYNTVKGGVVSPPPHVFSVAAAAVFNIREESRSQAVLISGESGAGKTETTKKILQFISAVSGSTSSRVGSSIENQILDSNPLLESFGNAKTLRNNNSSRFGKYMEVNFDKKYHIKGCNISSYLLEKSRVVKQGSMERNYHIFYMLLSGASKEQRQNYWLKPADQFSYLNQSGCLEINRRSDSKEFEELLQSVESLGIDAGISSQIFQLVAAILHLGNLTFGPSSTRDVDAGSRITSPSDSRRVASLLGINPDHLEKAMCFRDSLINGETILVPLNVQKATDQRDALAKYVYGKIFDYIVSTVNKSLFRGKPGLSIGVLDIFGFEVFKLNSFEQLCINYCNERLQTFFNEIIFDGEIKLYASEGIPCEGITFQDNMGCVRLIDLRGGGIFAYLDAEVKVPQGSDEKFVSKLNNVFEESAATKSPYFGRNRRSPLDFTVKHFAGDVIYNATNFMEKNKDALADSLLNLLQTSTMHLLVTSDESVAAASAAGAKKSDNRLTLAAKFKNDLDSLMSTLRLTSPHFIRCIKPNNDQAPNVFDSHLVLNQLKYSGLFEAIRIRKAGYPIRMTHQQFIKRYKFTVTVSKKMSTAIKNDTRACCGWIAKELAQSLISQQSSNGKSSVSSGTGTTVKSKGSSAAKKTAPTLTMEELVKQWAVGASKIFLRSQQLKSSFDDLRKQSSSFAAVPIQSCVRRFLARRKYLLLMGDRLREREERRRMEGTERDAMSKEDQISKESERIFRSDVVLQQQIIQAKQERARREIYRRQAQQFEAARNIQRIARGFVFRRRGRLVMCERLLERSLLQRNDNQLRRAIELPQKYHVTSKLIKVYQESARKLILEVLHESYVQNELAEATEIQSVEMLRDAIKLAEQSNMLYLKGLRRAKVALENALFLRSICATIAGVLSKCVTVPKLVARADVLRYLLDRATSCGLGGEPKVQEAALRVRRVRNLIQLRDQFRFAVEICCPEKMKSCIKERASIVHIYGDDLLDEEFKAVQGMLRMIRYQHQISGPQVGDEMTRTNSSTGGGGGTGVKFEDSLAAVIADNNDGADKVYLPPFVRTPLEDIRSATTSEELNIAIENLTKLVPDENKRKFFVRVFKWVVAFATWKYGPKSAVAEVESLQSTFGGDENAAKGVASSVGRLNIYSSDAALGSSQKFVHGSPTVESRHGSFSGSPTSLNRSRSRSPSATRKTSSNRDQSLAEAAAAVNIPFSQRQSKAQVLAYESIKKAKKVLRYNLIWNFQQSNFAFREEASQNMIKFYLTLLVFFPFSKTSMATVIYQESTNTSSSKLVEIRVINNVIVEPKKILLTSSNRRSSFYSTKDIIMIYEGSKTMWRQRTTMDIYIVRHKLLQIVEIICYSPSVDQEANRIYVSQALFKKKLSPNDLEEKMKIRMEVFIRQKKPLIHDELLQSELDEQITQYIISRINLKDSEKFEVTLSSQFICEDDIICEKPEKLEPLPITFLKTSTVSEFHAKLSQFREESSAVKKSYDRAMHALYSDAYHVSNEVIAHVHENYERKMKWSVPKRRWIRAINKIIFLAHLAKVKEQLRAIEEARIEKEGKIIRIKAQRKTLDNSQIDSIFNKRNPVKLPPVIESVRNQPIAIPAAGSSYTPSAVDEKNRLPHQGGGGGVVQQANRERRRNRHNVLQQRRSFDPATSASLSMFDSALQAAVEANHHHLQSPKAEMATLQRADSGRNSRRSLPPLSVEELLSAANRPAPSLINSYRDKSLQAMASIHSLSVSSFDIQAATAASALEAIPTMALIKESRNPKP